MLAYAVVTPVRDEAENLRRLGACLVQQSVRPTVWVIVDNGSLDETSTVASELASAYPWIKTARSRPSATAVPGAPIVRAFNVGLRQIEPRPDLVVKLDADISMDTD